MPKRRNGRCDIQHRLQRDSETHRADSDLWLCILDLALERGWRPEGVEPMGTTYVNPRGQRVTATDALELARCLEEALQDVSDQIVPLGDHDFGDEHTMGLIREAQQGTAPAPELVTAARELLSGPPKKEAAALLDFFRGGGFSLYPGRA